jgi:3-oxoacyl-[acyl-carrier protein] reductase
MKKKRVLVTGASRGIGAATAIRLAQHFDVTVHYCNSHEAAKEVSQKINEIENYSPQLLQFDINDRATTRSALEDDMRKCGAYYGVVCNAGIASDAAFPALSGEQWDSVIHTNLDGFYNVVQPLIMPMIRQRNGGRIVTMSSVSGLVGNRGQVNYSAAKAGLIGATKALALELAKRNITVNCVAPGIIETDMIAGIHQEQAKKMIPMGRFGQVDDIAATVDFLMSNSAAYITRQVISVNGGIC